MSFVAIEAIAFFAKIIFTVSAMVENFIVVVPLDIGTLTPSAASIETFATTVSS